MYNQFEAYTSVVFSVFTELYIHYYNQFLKMFTPPPPSKKPIPISGHSPSPLSPQSQATSNLLSISVDLPIQDFL